MYPSFIRIADNDWEIDGFNLEFKNNQSLARDNGRGNYTGWDWLDENNDGLHDGHWDTTHNDLNNNGVEDPGEREMTPQPVSYLRSGASLDANGNPVTTTVRAYVDFDITGTTTGTWTITGAAANQAFYTVVDIGSRKADGLKPDIDGGSAVAAAIWGEFSDRDVRRISDNHQLTYWAAGMATATNTAALLKDGNGQCGSWAAFLRDCWSAQGVTNTKIGVTSKYGGNSALLVKNWSFTGAGTSPDPTFTYLPGEYTDQLGGSGQGNDDPPSGFYNHFIIKFQGMYYDPSYGNGPFAGANDDAAHAAWEDASLDGFTQDFLVQDPATGLWRTETWAKKNDPGVGVGAANIETIFTELT